MNPADLAGQVLAGRYRLLHALGAGSGGRAYIAEDRHLGRRVAVKVLHAGLAGDPAFLDRFRAEARVVASLSHPNIVTLHDWGEDPVPFTVFELLQGGSLAALLQAGERLSAAQAAHLGAQVVAGLEHAHGRGLVHRDIKPGNLLFDERGTVKVADFGLARALAESGATAPLGDGGGIVGTARYAAPEQATGESLDGRGDLYSLALVLVEAVVGEVPLVGETPMATLAARAGSPIEAPVQLGALGVIVERAGMPLPVERYPEAGAMARAIEASAAMLPEAEPIPLPGLGVDLDEPVPTEMSAVAAREAAKALAPLFTGAPVPTSAGEEAVAGPERPFGAGERRVVERGRRQWLPWVVGVLAGLALSGAAWAADAARAPVVHSPNVVGQGERDAAAELAAAGLSLDVEERVHSSDPPGTVLKQEPEAGDGVRKGSGVGVAVSMGAAPVTLPAVAGQGEADAVRVLGEAGFEVSAEQRYDETVEAGKVVLQEPSTRQAPKGSPVTIVVSKGPQPVIVPNVVGKTAAEARAVLEQARFTVVTAEEYSDTVDKGKAIRQDPVSGAEIVPGSKVTVVVSKGPNRVMIPDVRGLTVEKATEKIEGVGLKADVIGYRPRALVKKQDPEGGLMLERGRTVTLFL